VAIGTLNRGGGACSRPAGSTPTPAGLQPISAPVLGATEHDFCLRYGSPSDAFDPFNSGPPSQSWQVSTIAGYQVDMLATDNDNARDSRDGRLRIADIEVSTLGGVPWDSSALERIMAVFLPADATFQPKATLQAEQDIGIGTYERIYTSAQLAATFTADYFTSSTTGLTVAPGTLSEWCRLLPYVSSATPTVPTTAEGTPTGSADDCRISVGSL